MIRQRVVIGKDAVVVTEDEQGLELECGVRLSPGRLVDVSRTAGTRTARTAMVWSWRLVRMGSSGPRYRGYCCWC